MKRSRFTEEQIIALLMEQEAGVPTAEVYRKHGVSSATLYTGSSGQSCVSQPNLTQDPTMAANRPACASLLASGGPVSGLG